jgi:hypothetical protein
MIASRVALRWLRSLSIDGFIQKKPSGGGKSAPNVSLVDVGVTDSGDVKQKWDIYANGQKVTVLSITDKNGDSKISGKDLDLGVGGLTAKQAVAYILQGAHPRYYPKPGKTITLDDKFIKEAINIYDHQSTIF